jgi:hypothetical protein
MYRRGFLAEDSRSAASRFIRVGRHRARRAAGRLVLGSLVCAASVMCATSARAQQVTRTQDYDQNSTWNDVNPCTTPNADVSFQGHTHSQNISYANGDYTTRIQQDGRSFSSSDGANYQYNFFQDIRQRSSTSNYRLTVTTRKHIIHISGGPAKDSWFVKEQITISPNSAPQGNNGKSEPCK